jgi:hypothetical protein
MKSGEIKGQWNHIDHGTGNHAHGDVRYLSCRHIAEPGPGAPKGTMNQAFYGGPARWREAATATWAEGYWFDVMAKDHGEGKGRVSGGPDYYHFTLRKQADPVKQMSGVIVYETHGDWGSSPGGGNFQIHMPNNGHPYTASSVPAWILPLEN